MVGDNIDRPCEENDGDEAPMFGSYEPDKVSIARILIFPDGLWWKMLVGAKEARRMEAGWTQTTALIACTPVHLQEYCFSISARFLFGITVNHITENQVIFRFLRSRFISISRRSKLAIFCIFQRISDSRNGEQ